MAKRYIYFAERNYYPNDKTFALPEIVDCLVAGCVPSEPIIDKAKRIVAFGSCFAGHIGDYLKIAGYNIASDAMDDGIVNTYAVHEALLDNTDNADVFILTLGLSEIWYDEPTGEVFRRIMPERDFDASRHKFRVATQAENLANLHRIVALIWEKRPAAQIIFTLSPVPLKVTYRDQSCLVANEASKANIRSALDELISTANDPSLFYFPSYELVRNCFAYPYRDDRRHVRPHVVEFVMTVFDHYFCGGVSADELNRRWRMARGRDEAPDLVDDNRLVATSGRGNLKKLAWQ